MNQLMKPQNESFLPGVRSQEPPENPHSPLRRAIEAQFRGRSLLVLLALLGATIGAAVGILKPNEFRSTATFLFRSGAEDLAVSTDPTVPAGWGRPNNGFQNAPYLLMQKEVAKRTIDKVGKMRVLQSFQPREEDAEGPRKWILTLQAAIHNADPLRATDADAIGFFLSHLTVEPVRLAALIDVSYSANDPALAQEILTEYVEQAQGFHLEQYESTKAIKIANANFKEREAAYHAATAAYAAILRESGLTNFDSEFADLKIEAGGAAKAWRALEDDQIPSLELGIAESKKRLEQTERTIIQNRPPVLEPNEVLAQLTTELSHAESELRGIVAKFNPETSDAKRAQAKVDAIRKSLEQERNRERKFVTPPPEVVENPAYLALLQYIQQSESDLAEKKRSVVAKRRIAQTLKERVDKLAALAPRVKQLESDAQQCRSDLHAAQVARAQAQSKQELENNKISNLKLVSAPTFQPQRVGPRRGQMALIGLLAGLAAGMGLLSVRALTDSTVRTPEELEHLLGLRVLATVPDLRRKHIRRHENRVLSGC